MNSFELFEHKFDNRSLKLLWILLMPSDLIANAGKENLMTADFSKPIFSQEYENAVIDELI